MDIGSIRDELKTLLGNVSGLRTYDTIPDVPNTPAAVVRPAEQFLDYHPSMGSKYATASFEVLILVQRASERAAQDALDGYLSSGTSETSSIIDAIEADATLNGAVDDTIVRAASDYGPMTWNDITYLGARLDVDVIVSRS